MAEFPMTLLYSMMGADMEDNDQAYDPASHILVYAELELFVPLNNHAKVNIFVHHPGDPHKTVPDHIVHPTYKGESVSISKEGTGLRVNVNGHSTFPQDQQPPKRLTTLESVVLPGIFPA